VTLPSGERFAGLDGLRAFAVAMVVWHNFGPLPFSGRFGTAGELRAGYIGVTIFFTLSGFLITHLLVSEWTTTGRIKIAAFYLRRLFRLFPALLVALGLLMFTAVERGHPWDDTVRATLTALGYVFNFAAARAPLNLPLGGAGWGHLWSLSVEEQFYALWPLVLVVALPRWSRRHVLGALIIVTTAITLWRTILWSNNATFFRLYLLTDVRIDAMIAGAALAIARFEFPSLAAWPHAPRWIVGPSLVVLAVVAHRGSGADPAARPGWLLGPGMSVVTILSALVIWALASGSADSVSRLLDSSAARAVGKRSYGIYLFHYPVEALLGDRSGGWFLSLVVTAAVTEISYRFVELPALRRLPISSRRR
jgi:peptidoglycan/LPS O-acetylase OafA/YrhL